MGELIQRTVVQEWTATMKETTKQIIHAAKTRDKVLAAFAEADARVLLMRSLENDQLQAKLLAMTDPEFGMVELVNNPTDQDRIRITALAIMSGFAPGNDEFAVFSGGFDKRSNKQRPGKLYIKRAGFRTLFSHFGLRPHVQVGFPEFVEYGTAGKKAWRVEAEASCVVDGEVIRVWAGLQDNGIDGRINLPGYDSDNVAAIEGKAKRRILQALWETVSPIMKSDLATDDDEDLPTETLVTKKPAAIESAPVVTQDPSPADLFNATWRDEFRGCKDDAVNDIARRLHEAWQVSDSDSVAFLKSQVVEKIKAQRNKDKLIRFADAITDRLLQEAGES